MLYRACELTDIFCAKYGVDRNDASAIESKQVELENAVSEKRSRIESRKLQLEERKQKAAENRTVTLVAALQRSGLTLRSDSELCAKYVEGKLRGWMLEKVCSTDVSDALPL